MSILQIKLEEFEGPLDLLLKLIDKNKIDIYDIPISKLTDDYLYYIKHKNIIDMEEMSQFIIMATTLLEIKSKLLLPKEKDEQTNEDIDPREELVKKLIEYKKYKMIAEKLYNIEVFADKVIFKEADIKAIDSIKIKTKPTAEEMLEGITLKSLYNVFEEVLKRKELKTDKIRSKFKSVTKALYNINDKISYIKDLIILNEKISLNKIFEESSSRVEVVVTFLAVLELIKTRDIKVVQQGIFDEIIIMQGE
ncbi:segregation/condensation protein A [uncultured Tyzzerella sp.]|uniref:segregation and condensation protein A n=1 Tax=uncultured Tyzzerella sp. TaxID=2321398 RepID=UPI002943585D|nr:segregation/condensation protein A [uncultured Tyzzerella sp.]